MTYLDHTPRNYINALIPYLSPPNASLYITPFYVAFEIYSNVGKHKFFINGTYEDFADFCNKYRANKAAVVGHPSTAGISNFYLNYENISRHLIFQHTFDQLLICDPLIGKEIIGKLEEALK